MMLQSYLAGRFVSGSGKAATLVNPTTEAVVAEASTGGLELAPALAYARKHGAALRALSFKQRGALCDAVAKIIHTHREALLDLAVENGGNTRGDAKFDVDGAMGTLAYYARLGDKLGDARVLVDGEAEALGKSPRLVGRHIYSPLHGVAVLVNAFNFPAWGFAEKAAVAWLSGMPVLVKPATSTALVAARLVELIVEAKVLPDGALSALVGSAGDLTTHLTSQDVLAFTGSSHTATTLRRDARLTEQAVRINVEADSLNSAVLGPDVTSDGDAYTLFLREVVRDMTQKAGQKCTAIRRVLVPRGRLHDVARDLADAVRAVKVGDPSVKEVGVGPLATAQQRTDVRAGIERLGKSTKLLVGDGGRGALVGIEGDKGYFVAPVLALAEDARTAAVHGHEVFGPVATVLPYDESAQDAVELMAMGGGSLVASIYSDDPDFALACVAGAAPHHGRLNLGSSKVAEHSMGPGTVLPQFLHGGPGRAGGGEELGGTRSLRFYMQRTAVQGYAPWLDKLGS